MPCSDSSSSINLCVDRRDRFISFDFAKITCGREITGETGFSRYCVGKSLKDILNLTFAKISKALKVKEEEANFILYLEWDALRCAIAQYLGEDIEGLDRDRCQISSITQGDREEAQVSMVILPPKELPKILPCSLAQKN